jgi:tRNA(fMet)-specific endonuclease VapC
MADYLLDTNVLSRFFYGDANVKQFLGGIDSSINTIVYIELIQGSIKKKQRELIKTHLAKLAYYTLTPEISLKAVELIDKYSSSHGLFLADALIASTAIVKDLNLVTFNLKDFEFINGLSVIKP